MASRTLAVNVTTPDETGRMVTYMAGDTVSDEVAEGITAENVWAEARADGDGGSASKAPAKKSASSKSKK